MAEFGALEQWIGDTAIAAASRSRVLHPTCLLQIARESAEGLANLHATSLVHRDLAPRNLLVNGRGEVLVADLGLARYGSYVVKSEGAIRPKLQVRKCCLVSTV